MEHAMEIRVVPYDPAAGDVLLWPDAVDAYWADAACTIRFPYTRKNWGYTYQRLQGLHPEKRLAEFRADDLVAYVTQRGWDGPRWAPLSARNQRIALSGLCGWAYLVGRVPVDPAAQLGRLVRIPHQRARAPHWLNDIQIAALIAATDGDRLADRRDRVVLMLGRRAADRRAVRARLARRGPARRCAPFHG
jgi:integrase